MGRPSRFEIRPLAPGEEREWIACGAAPEEVDPKLATFLERRASYPELPICFLVALLNGKMAGKLRGSILGPRRYLIGYIRSACGIDYADVSAALLAWARSQLEQDLESCCWDTPEEARFGQALEHANFALRLKKPFVKRPLIGYRNPYPDPFTYRTLQEVGKHVFAEALAQVCRESLSADMHIEDPRIDLQESIEQAGRAFDPKSWKLALLEDELAGLIVPQRFPDAPRQGTLFQIGLVPRWRGRNLGKVLHAAGLETLAGSGAEEYIGSTDIANEPMLKVFAANLCNVVGTRLIYAGS